MDDPFEKMIEDLRELQIAGRFNEAREKCEGELKKEKDPVKRVRLLTQEVVCLRALVRYDQALGVVEKEYLPLAKKIEGKEGKALQLLALQERCWCLSGLKRTNEALRESEALVKEALGEFGENSRNYWEALGCRQGVLMEAGEYRASIELIEAMLEAMSQDKTYPHYGFVLSNHALAHEKVHEYAKSLELYLQVLELAKGGLVTNYATGLVSCGALYLKLRFPSRARSYFEEALEIELKAFGSKHPSTLKTQEWIAAARRAQVDRDYRISQSARGVRICLYCLKVGPALKCLSCLQVYYCNQKCKDEDEDRHENECVMIDEEKACIMCHQGDCEKKCTGCAKVRYCGKECQLKDWPSHKTMCQEWKNE